MIKAVLIDIDNTLLDFNKSADLAIKMGCEKYALPYNDITFPTFKRINDQLWKRIEKKTLTRKELHEIRFDLIFSELKIDFDGKTFEKTFLENLNVCACKIDGAEDIMRYLSQKYAVFTASNAPSEQQIKRLNASGLMKYVKKPFISQAIGYDKPDSRFFDNCFNQMDGITKEESILIGDSLSADIKGGINYGIKTIWYNFEKIKVNSPADYTVNSLEEIKNIL